MKNKLVILLILVTGGSGFSQTRSRTSLIAQANVIKNEAEAKRNTSLRIGTMFIDMLNNMPVIPYGTTAVGSGTYTMAVPPSVTAYHDGDFFLVKFTNTNSDISPTLALGSLAVKQIVNPDGTSIGASGIPAGSYQFLGYDGVDDNFKIIGGISSGGGGGSVPLASAVVSGIMKLYGITGSNTDGTITQAYITALLAGKQPLDADLTSLGNISASNGDIIMRASGAYTRLPIGTSNQVLTVIAGLPSWQDASTGVTNFTALTDGPGSFIGKTLNFLRVNAAENALEYQSPSQVRTDLSINNIDNTSDANKPVSTAQAAADALKFTITNNLSEGTPSTMRTNLGATTIGSNLFTLTNPSAITFPRYNADNTVSALSASAFRTAIGSGTGDGTVTSVTSADANATVATTTTAPVITIVSAPKWTTGRTIGITGDVTYTSPSLDGSGNVTASATVTKINGTSLAALGTGILKNTTTTGVPSIAVVADFPTLNQNTTGSAATLTTPRTIGIITGDGTSSGSPFDGSANNTNAFTLATVNSNTGSFGSSTSIPTFTVNAKGLITAASGNAVIAPAGTLTGTTLNSTVVNSSLTSVATIGTGTWQGTAIADSYIASAAAWNAKVSSQWTTTGSDIYFANKVLIGESGSPSSNLHVVTTSTSTPRGPLFDQYSTTTNSSRAYFRKARGTFASPSVITSGDAIGNLVFSGYDGTNFTDAAEFLVTSTGTISTGVVQSTMALRTANSSGTLTNALTLDGSQNATFGGTISATNFSGTSSNTNSGDVTLAGENYLSISGQVITANAVNLSGTNVTGTLAAGRFPALSGEATTSAGSLSVTLDNAAVIGKVLTGYVSGSGTISATDNILQAIQKLNGNDAGKWSLASGGTLTGVNTIASNANSQIIFGGTWTATGNSQYHVNIGGTLTSLTGNSTLYGTLINTTMTAGATGHTLSLLRLDAGNLSATNSPTRYALNALGSVLITTSAGTGASTLTVNNSTGSVSTNFDVQNTGTSVFKVSSSGSVTFAPSTATTAAAYTFAGNTQTATSGAQNIFTVSTSNKAGANNDVLSILNITSTMDVNTKTGVNMQGIYYNPTVTGSPNLHFAWQHTSGYVQWNSVLSPAQITSNQNDYNPTGLNTGGAPNGASILRVTTDVSRNLTSVVGGATGRLLIIANVGSFDLVIKNDDGSTGTAANRFALNADITLSAGKSLIFWYDGTSSRWRVNSL